MSAKKLKTRTNYTTKIESLDLIDIDRRIEELNRELAQLLERREEIYTNHNPKKRPSYLC